MLEKLLAKLKFQTEYYRFSDLKNDKQDKNNIPPPRSSISGASKCMDEIKKDI